MPAIDFTQLFLLFLILIISLTVHEAAHAWSADRLGDSTARMLGRVSFNPAVHIDPIGTILFPLIALATNFPLLGWAKPVPVNAGQLRDHWREKFMVIAAAGPASNLAIAAVAAGIFHLMPSDASINRFLLRAVDLNVFLAVFNMVPVPPLDGGNVLSGLLRGPVGRVYDMLRPYGFIILYALMFSGTLFRLVDPPAQFLVSLLY